MKFYFRSTDVSETTSTASTEAVVEFGGLQVMHAALSLYLSRPLTYTHTHTIYISSYSHNDSLSLFLSASSVATEALHRRSRNDADADADVKAGKAGKRTKRDLQIFSSVFFMKEKNANADADDNNDNDNDSNDFDSSEEKTTKIIQWQPFGSIAAST